MGSGDWADMSSLRLGYAALAACLGAMGTGAAIGFSSPAIHGMMRDSELKGTEVLPRAGVTIEEAADPEVRSWIVSALTLGALLGGLIGGPLAQMYGRRSTLIGHAVPWFLGWAAIYVASSCHLIIAGRFLTGICVGSYSAVIPMYLVEISTLKLRGLLGALFQVNLTLGILLATVAGNSYTWPTLGLMCAATGGLMNLMMIFAPESATHLTRKGYSEKEIYANLQSIRGKRQAGQILSEMKQLHDSFINQPKNVKLTQAWVMLRRRDVYKPLTIAIGLMFFQQFSGLNAIILYQKEIVTSLTSSSMTANWSTSAISLAQVAGTMLGLSLVERCGRKPLLVVSSMVNTVCLIVLAWYYYAMDKCRMIDSNMSLIAIVALGALVASVSTGYRSIAWLLIPEIAPDFIRGLVSGVSVTFTWACIFLIAKNFEMVKLAIGFSGMFVIFTTVSALSVVFSGYYVQETKGKTLKQICDGYQKRPKLVKYSNHHDHLQIVTGDCHHKPMVLISNPDINHNHEEIESDESQNSSPGTKFPGKGPNLTTSTSGSELIDMIDEVDTDN